MSMRRATKDAWLGSDVGDLKEKDLENVPAEGMSVRVRSLPAAYSNLALSEATVFKTQGREQIATIDQSKLQVLQFAYGLVEPQFSVEEAQVAAEKWGPMFERVVEEIGDMSGIDQEAIQRAQKSFPNREGSEEAGEELGVANGSGDDRSADVVRAGVGTEDDG